jgi:ADP-glucose pyrophosphorylase
VIAVGIVAGTGLFYGSDYEFRLTESLLLNKKVKDCVTSFGVNNQRLKNDFFGACKINESIVDKGLGIKVCVDSSNCIIEKNPLIQEGSNFQVCGIERNSKKDEFPRCALLTLKGLEGKNVQIITYSNHEKRRVTTG